MVQEGAAAACGRAKRCRQACSTVERMTTRQHGERVISQKFITPTLEKQHINRSSLHLLILPNYLGPSASAQEKGHIVMSLAAKEY